MFAWQATVQDEYGNAVPLPVVTVYQPNGVDLADIYDDAGGALANPVTGTLDGFVQFWVPGGQYRVKAITGTGETNVWQIDLGGTSYPTRGAFVDAVADGLRYSDGTVIVAGGLRYMAQSGASAIPGLGGWVPYGDVCPEHWGAVADGVANDYNAILEALAWSAATGATIVFRGQSTYRWTSAVEATDARFIVEEGCTMDVPYASLIVNGATVVGRFGASNSSGPLNVGKDGKSVRFLDHNNMCVVVAGDNGDSTEWNSIGWGVNLDMDGPSEYRPMKGAAFKTYMAMGRKAAAKGTTEGTESAFLGQMSIFDTKSPTTYGGISEHTPLAIGAVCHYDGATNYEQVGGNYYNDIVLHGPCGTNSAKRANFQAGVSVYTSAWTPSAHVIDADHKGAYGITVFTDNIGNGFGGGGVNRSGLSSRKLTAGVSIQGWSGAGGAAVSGGHAAGATSGYEVGLQIGGSSGSVWTNAARVGSRLNTGISVEDYGGDLTSPGIIVKKSHFGDGVNALECYGPSYFTTSANKATVTVEGYGASLGAGIRFNATTDTAITAGFYNASGTAVGSITQTGTTTAYNTSSDKRLKEDWQEFDGLYVIERLEVWDHAWKDAEGRSKGVLAQDAHEVAPYAITPAADEEGVWAVDYSKLVPDLIRAVQQLAARVKKIEGCLE